MIAVSTSLLLGARIGETAALISMITSHSFRRTEVTIKMEARDLRQSKKQGRINQRREPTMRLERKQIRHSVSTTT